MTAGVQNLEPAAYLPAPPSTSSQDVKGTGAADASDAQGADRQSADGEPHDFRSELDRQDTAAEETKSTGQPEKGSGKPGKKRDTRVEDPNPNALPAVQVAEPQKQILPLVLALPKPEENTEPEAFLAVGAQLSEIEESTKLRQPAMHREALPSQTPQANAALPGTPDSTNAPIPNLAVKVPEREEATRSERASATSTKSGASSESQPASRNGLRLPDAIRPEPAVAAPQVAVAPPETADTAPSSPSALAFAARLAAASQKAGEPVSDDPSQSPALPASTAPVRIPVRHAATAQILPKPNVESKRELKNEPGAFLDRPARTEMVLPRVETAREAASNPRPAAPEQAAPSARMDRVYNPPLMEPPAAPPTSARDIRVRVPDNNGGSTHVRFVESGGEVRVSVRTADEGLAQNLRSHLNDLTQRLADGGIPAEMWKPGSSAASQQNDHHQPDRDGRGSGGQEPGGRGGQQRNQQEERPAWLEEMEASLHGSKK